MKYWETIADNLHKAGWSLDWVSALDLEGRTIWIVDSHRGDGKRFIVRADELLTAFLELELAIRREFVPGGFARSASRKIRLWGAPGAPKRARTGLTGPLSGDSGSPQRLCGNAQRKLL